MGNVEESLFGHADGGVEGSHGFIKLDRRWGDIALDPTNRRIRILVGRRGAGKSRYLRAMERETSARREERTGESLLVFPQRDESVWIAQMRWLHRQYPEEAERLDTWRKLWGSAIYVSLATYLINFVAPAGTSINVSQQDREILERYCVDALGTKAAVSYPIVAVLNQILKRFGDRSRLESFLGQASWVALEHYVLKAIAGTTPIACFVDTLDDTYAAAPAAATDCQVGLLLWMMKKFVDPHTTNRLHIVVTVRDTIFAKLVQSEHGLRYDRSDLLTCLDWTKDAAATFFCEKVAGLPSNVRVAPGTKDSPVESWLGFETVPSYLRDHSHEAVVDLLVRHTRFLPREIIVIGNAVGKHVVECLRTKRPVEERVVYQIILSEARRLAELALETAVDHLMALDSQHDSAIVDRKFRESVLQAITKKFIPALKHERFTGDILMSAEESFTAEVGGWSAIFDQKKITLGEILWLHGLIGIEDISGPEPIARYFSSTKSLRSLVSGVLPKANNYYLHSSLLLTDKILLDPKPPRVEAAVSDD